MKKSSQKTDFLQVLHSATSGLIEGILDEVTGSEVAIFEVTRSIVGGLFAGLFTGLYAM